MNLEHSMQEMAKELSEAYPFFESYKLNEFGAPMLDGSSIFDMGFFLLVIDEVGQPANSVSVGRLMGVVKLTIKNWLKKSEKDALAVVEKAGLNKQAHYVLHDWGVYSKDTYEPFRPYVRLMIQRWRSSEDGNASSQSGTGS